MAKKLLLLIISVLMLVTQTSFFNPNIKQVAGKFYGNLELTRNGVKDTHYQFRSNDDSVWWLLTADEIGCVPDRDTEYVLTYDNNGTTRENKPCDCAPEFDCECELYDDTFLSIKEK